jgi:fido (protein-threonine AMPylation protein)
MNEKITSYLGATPSETAGIYNEFIAGEKSRKEGNKEVEPINADRQDTGTEESRRQRELNEYAMESLLSQMAEMSSIERLTLIREQVFKGFDNVKGDIATKVRSVPVTRGGSDKYPNELIMATELFPNFIKRVDEMYDAVKNIPDPKQRSESAIRLAAFIYNTGMATHPYRDGNGQTIRQLALSYIQELDPTSRNKFLPMRKESEREKQIRFNLELDTTTEDVTPDTIEEEQRLKRLALKQLLEKQPTEDAVGDEGRSQAWLAEVQKHIPEATIETAEELLKAASASIEGEQIKTDMEVFLQYILSDEAKRFNLDWVLGKKVETRNPDANKGIYLKHALLQYQVAAEQISGNLEGPMQHRLRKLMARIS